MDRMEDKRGEDKLVALWAEYRQACPDPEPSANFMPQVWQRIEARRRVTSSLRRWAEACVMAALTLTLLIAAILIPRYQRQPVYQSTYADVLAEADSPDYTLVLTEGDIR
jgi:anti-sigma-K factor RskA